MLFMLIIIILGFVVLAVLLVPLGDHRVGSVSEDAMCSPEAACFVKYNPQ